ncbi:uncharacterized protein LOC124418137 [Gallus gallus]|uniref:uncharacterized protein LOC124418137 n=1 Tax=Gallus gallus TaxID=9031 RepID=UPI001F027EB3|nr:uncharacterized protein LOC124418137 [Gallus gallus]XP_046800625.1 uncharacterized protein LOC124418137 [Gallus gallus]
MTSRKKDFFTIFYSPCPLEEQDRESSNVRAEPSTTTHDLLLLTKKLVHSIKICCLKFLFFKPTAYCGRSADCSGKTTDKFCLSVLLVFLFWTLLWPGCDALGVPVAGQWKLYRG